MASVFIDRNTGGRSTRNSRPEAHDWYIVSSNCNGDGDSDRYLHRDGVWRHSTWHANGFTGYFPSQQAAEDMAKSLELEYTVRLPERA